MQCPSQAAKLDRSSQGRVTSEVLGASAKFLFPGCPHLVSRAVPCPSSQPRVPGGCRTCRALFRGTPSWMGGGEMPCAACSQRLPATIRLWDTAR